MIGLVVAVAAGILIGFIRGGSLRTLGDTDLRAVWVVFVGVGLQLASTVAEHADLGGLALGLVLASFTGVLWFAALNFRLPGMTLIALGALCNLVVISVNGGMPVSREALEKVGLGDTTFRGAHHALTDDSRLTFLADVIPISVSANVVSVGDIIIWAGILLLIQQLMVGPRGKRRRGAKKISARSEPG